MRSNWATASIKNIRTQRQLELELLDIEKRWNLELKYINRQRLGIIYDLNRYNNQRRNAKHISASLCGQQLRKYTRGMQDKMLEERAIRRRARKFEFDVDPVDHVTLRLPPIDVDTTAEKHGIPERITAMDLNIKRASFQKEASELNQLIIRSMRRKRHSMADSEDDDEDELGEPVGGVDDIDGSDTKRPNLSSRSTESLLLPLKGSTTARSLPPIYET